MGLGVDYSGALRNSFTPTPLTIDRRKLTFKLKVFDDVEQVGEAEHDRFIVDLDKYMERLKKKIAG